MILWIWRKSDEMLVTMNMKKCSNGINFSKYAEKLYYTASKNAIWKALNFL